MSWRHLISQNNENGAETTSTARSAGDCGRKGRVRGLRGPPIRHRRQAASASLSLRDRSVPYKLTQRVDASAKRSSRRWVGQLRTTRRTDGLASERDDDCAAVCTRRRCPMPVCPHWFTYCDTVARYTAMPSTDSIAPLYLTPPGVSVTPDYWLYGCHPHLTACKRSLENVQFAIDGKRWWAILKSNHKLNSRQVSNLTSEDLNLWCKSQNLNWVAQLYLKSWIPNLKSHFKSQQFQIKYIYSVSQKK